MNAPPVNGTTPICLDNDALPPGWGPWDLPAGWQLERDSGPDGGPALRHTRTNPAEYLNARLRLPLRPGERYQFSAKIRVEESAGPETGACAGVEFFDAENRFLGGGYLSMASTASTWVDGETDFTVPPFTDECRLLFYLRAGTAGTARFAAPVIGPAPFRWTVYLLTPVRDELPAAGGNIPFGFFSQGAPATGDGWRCRVEVLTDSTRIAGAESVVRDGRFTIPFGPLPPGPVSLRLTLRDGRGTIAGERTIPVTVVDDRTAQERANRGCVIDDRGRIRIERRPFLPLGLYLAGIERPDLDGLAGSPFNCLLPYSSPSLKFAGSTREGVAAVREVLDACHDRGLKVIFSLANTYDDHANAFREALGVRGGLQVAQTAVREFRNHPALLAWYVNDEQAIGRLPVLLDRRRELRRLDPDHPIYAVMCQFPELPFFTDLCDVYGIDPYPIVDPGSNHIRTARYAHDMAGKAAGTGRGLALWTVVQAHNVGIYDPKAAVDPAFYREAYRDPSLEEIAALALLALIRGAKGLVFYSYFDLPRPEFDVGARDRRWANLCRVGRAIREAEPFLLSDAEAPRIDLRVEEGEIEARAFRDDAGRTCVLLAGIGPGPCRAELAVPGPTALVSRMGRTVARGGGRYRFEGHHVSADILMDR